MLLSSAEDGGTGPSARSVAGARALIQCARDMACAADRAPPAKMARGRWRGEDAARGGRLATSAVVFALFESVQSLGQHFVRVEPALPRPEAARPRGVVTRCAVEPARNQDGQLASDVAASRSHRCARRTTLLPPRRTNPNRRLNRRLGGRVRDPDRLPPSPADPAGCPTRA